LPAGRRGKTLEDLCQLYDGSISRAGSFLLGGRSTTLTTPDGLVIASPHPERPKEALVGIKELQLPKSAQRWTALNAYMQKAGVSFDYLRTEVPGTRPYEEWINRHNKTYSAAHDKLRAEFSERREALIQDVSLPEKVYDRKMQQLYDEEDAARKRIQHGATSGNFIAGTSAGSDNDQTTRFFKRVTGNVDDMFDAVGDAERAQAAGDSIGFEMASRAYEQAASASDRGLFDTPPALPDKYTEFYAYADNLPAAARVMASNYGALLFRNADEDPDLAGAQALGVPNLGRLDTLWEDAMAQRTPVAAGQYVLRSLAS